MGDRSPAGPGGVEEMRGIIYNESPEERTERFMRLVEAEERRRLKEEYKAERRNVKKENNDQRYKS